MSDRLLECSINAGAFIATVYEWLDRVNDAGGATTISGVAQCHAMLKSLAANRARVDTLIAAPLKEAIEQALTEPKS